METAFLVDDIDVIGLESHDPSRVQCRGIFYLHQGLQGSMICDHLEWSSFKEMSEMFHSPYNSELFQLCCSIILNSSGIGLTCITDDLFPVDLLSFLVVLPLYWEILC